VNELDLFSAALELADPAARSRFLEENCGADTPFRERLEALLRNANEASRFLETPAIIAALGTEPAVGAKAPDGADSSMESSRANVDFLSPSDDPAALGCLGPYSVTDVVGAGGMGIVLKARDESLHRVVALKVLAPELSTNPTARKRFLREGRSAAAVVHQHVVTIHAVAEDRLPYLVMEYVKGPSLQAKIDAEGPLDLKVILRVAAQVAAGLVAAHAQGVIHRDIKPSNILLENGIERVRITDFGLARAVDDVEITRPGEVAGTPQYMSPEQAQGQSVDARSDLFSFGCVLYAMCTGRPPFRAETTIEAIRRVSDDDPRPIREINADVPEWLTEIIDRLLAKRPDDRIQTAHEVTELLGRSLAHVQDPGAAGPPVALPKARKPDASPNPACSRRWTAAAAIVLLAAAILGITEAAGVTQLSGTVVRIITGEGSLVIETNDPTIEVSLDGEELTIRGGGVNQFKFRPGQYQFVATKNGRPIKQELVTITRGGRNVVTISREAESLASAGGEAKSQPGAFVLLGAGAVVGKYDTLADAVQAASVGEMIEIRGNGPFVTKPVVIAGTPLIIRAGRGFEPVIQLEKDEQKAGLPLLKTDAALTLEGLELRREFEGLPVFPERTLLVSWGAPLNLSHCRFVTGDYVWAVHSSESSRLEVRDCLFAGGSLYWAPAMDGRLLVHNCLIACRFDGVIVEQSENVAGRASVRFTRNTIYASGPFRLINGIPAEAPATKPGSSTIWETAQNLFDGNSLFAVATTGIADLNTALATLPDWLSWRDSRNLYSIRGNYVNVWPDPFDEQILPAVQGLSEWLAVWKANDTGSIEGQPRYRSLRLTGHDLEPPLELREADFRLHSSSPGYRAGPDGKNLGADIDLVGPGEAYERWKKTPEHQQWLKETGQKQ
jgi:tRNA A-37 threonylcarbamoyl transferase component Bud32